MTLSIASDQERGCVVPAEKRILEPGATMIVTRTKSVSPAESFRSRKGLNVWETFADHFDLNKPTEASASECIYKASFLAVPSCDRHISGNLPEEHRSTLEDLAIIIGAQSSGEPGFLLVNGYLNIAYAKGKNRIDRSVVIYWDFAYEKWNIFACYRGGNGNWPRGSRVLYSVRAAP